MKTIWQVIPPIGEIQTFEDHTLPKAISFERLKKLVTPHLSEGEELERVAVLWEGVRRDMFVGETSSINGADIRNVRATEIYRNFTLVHDPDRDPKTLPAICGPAVLFSRQVWF